jgi:beta-lactam-binding protein with PASTA domain
MIVSSVSPAFVPVQAQGVQPAGAGFALDAGDLRFILKQIQIAEAHAAGGSLSGLGEFQVPEPRLPFGLRTVDGTFNHLVPGQETFGAADQIFPRLTTSNFRPAEGFDPDGEGPQPGVASSSYAQTSGVVFDSQPRIISNLIVDQTAKNPAAAAAAGVEPDPLATESLDIPNVAPDEGLSAPFNSMMTFFGQFFDHGLDLVTKGGGTVFIPLQEDDPLFSTEPGALNFMLVTRATNPPGTHEAVNTTTPFVDQNQTYTSHPSHQVFLREYARDLNGKPRATGRMIDSVSIEGNIANWAEVKAQARTLLGIGLVDQDIFNVPLLATDAYGRFLRGPNGYPVLMLPGGGAREGNPASPVSTAGALKTGHAFLDDIAHNAVPGTNPDGSNLVADGDDDISNAGDIQPAGTYDDELLAVHFITGDGRGNENIALTAVHTVFHSEHNRLAGYIDGLIHDGTLTLAEVAQWEQNNYPTGYDYGERLFQAARFVTEMQYQHLVFEEFARTISPSINAFVGDGINFTTDVNPAISAEFAHATYRLGHSMLADQIARTAPDGTPFDIGLIEAFLNPLEFNRDGNGGILTGPEAAGAIFQGGTRQSGQAIDEFVVEAVRSNLLGLPLDLAAINIARGRSEGVPPLNQVRQILFSRTGDTAMRPYQSWADFGENLKHPESLVNFIAAYGTHPDIQNATTVEDKRQAANDNLLAMLFAPASTSGLNNVDLWIGGLAEQIAPFGGMLGSTFNFVFERQLENLQNADRFYYLERLDGLNLLAQMEGNSFSEMISRNTTAKGMAGVVFNRPDFVFNLDTLINDQGEIIDDPTTAENELELVALGELAVLADGTVRYSGGGHAIWNGRAGDDRIRSSIGDDTLRGNDGNDVIEGGAGNEEFLGGNGDDILTDLFGDDVIKGGPGNDAIHGGAGPFDLLQGNEGHDFIVGGNDASEVFGGAGNDIIYVGQDLTESFGGAGDDWIEGADQPASVLVGDENNQLQNDPNGGHDVIIAGPGDADFDAEGGDDILVANVFPTHRLEGMLGFDWATYRGEIRAVDADMLVTGATAVNAPLNENRDRYDLTEGLSGTNFNDLLRGDDRIEAELRDDGLTGVANAHVLTAAGIARISGLAALLPAGATEFAGGNIILGGRGADLLEGRGGNDIIDGDAWLNVQLQAPGRPAVDSLHAYKEDVFAGLLNPGAISIVRSIVDDNNDGGDVAVFSGARTEYIIDLVGPGVFRVTHVGGTASDGIDIVRNVETLRFAGVDVATSGIGALVVPNLSGLTQAQAAAALPAGLTIGTVDPNGTHPSVPVGTVAGQSPLPGVGVAAGTAVNIVISRGALIPDIHESSVADGSAALVAAGVVPGAVIDVNDPEIPVGFVAATNPAADSIVPPGTVVNILRSLGPLTAGIVPVTAGLDQGDAEEAIVAAGFTVGAITFANSNTVAAGGVISTNPAAGATPALGSAVAIRVSLGSDGLVVALGFDEAAGDTTAVNSSVTANDGVLRQANMQRVAGKFGTALRFDGVDDWVTITDGVANSPLDLTTGMTIEAWVNPSARNGWDTIVMKQRGAGLLSYALYANDGSPDPSGTALPASYMRVNGVDQPARGLVSLPLNTWTHVASTYDGTTHRLFINGVQVRAVALSTAIAVGNQQLRIGGNNAFANEFFAGLIDEVRIYNRARTAAQIQADMNTPIVP